MSNFFSQLSSIINSNPSDSNEQQTSDRDSRQSPFDVLSQKNNLQRPMPGFQQPTLSTIPLPLLSQLPNPQQLQQQQQQQQQQQEQNLNRPMHSNNQQDMQQKVGYQKLQKDNFMPASFSNVSFDSPIAQYNYMPGTASLIEDIDKQLMVILRDGRTLIGYLRSIDQFANLLLSSTIERIHVGTKYGDIPRGIYMIRGENVVLLGEVDFETPLKVNMTKVSVEEILELQRIEKKKQEEADKTKKKALLERCLIPHTDAILDEYY